MVTHIQISTGVADVDKFINKHELPLEKVKITTSMSRCKMSYIVFYNKEDDKHPELDK